MSANDETILPKRIGLRNLPVVVRKEVIASQNRLPCPIEIKDAVKAIQACSDLLDLKQWGDKSDALAAWAKIYNDDKISMEARRLKVRIFAQASKVADKLRPVGVWKGKHRKGGLKGPISALTDAGWRLSHAVQVRAVGSIPERELEEVLDKQKPPTPAQIYRLNSGKRRPGNTDFYKVVWNYSGNCSLVSALVFVRKHKTNASELASGHSLSEAKKARESILELQEWLDEYEQHLPK